MNMQQKRDLEALIDNCGLQTVMQTIGAICDEKAAHILTNWQDSTLASAWNRAGKAVDRVANAHAVVNLP